ncbi:MAG: ornithine cyclodeaminase family protein [Acidobacteria bacterium]|nr:MAG: ornithine cyclodeaminase family protein [Acidobacteriota bacterium]
MSVLILSGDDVRALLPMATCIELMAGALRTLAEGEAVQPLRQALGLTNGKGLLGVMPAQLATPPVAGVKVITVMPGNHARGLDSHQGTVQLFDVDEGRPLAILDAASITEIRTAAASGLATRLLARDDAAELALLGSGVQARSHLEAMRAVRPIRRVRVWSRTLEHARRFADRAAAESGLEVVAVDSARQAVAGADVVCTLTGARRPIVEGEWLAPGCHVNAVGACTKTSRELDGAAVARARVFVDRRESAENEAGDLILARDEGAIGDDHVAGELGDLLTGRVAGRTAAEEITLFESLGIGVEDLAAGWHVYRRARDAGRGIAVSLGD